MRGPIDEACGCMVCRRYSRAYLRHFFVAGEALGMTLNSVHNLAVLSGYDGAGAGGLRLLVGRVGFWGGKG